MASAEREPTTGGLGSEPPAGFRGRDPGHESGDEALLKLKAAQHLNMKRKRQICLLLCILQP